MSYYRSEENVYCTSLKTTVGANSTVDNISVHAKGPCRISSIIAKFDSSASNDFIVTLTRDNLTIELINVTLENNQNVVATDINVWIPNAGHDNYKNSKLTITNNTGSSATVLIDYAY